MDLQKKTDFKPLSGILPLNVQYVMLLMERMRIYGYILETAKTTFEKLDKF